MVNYFGEGIDAERYARVRPYIHPTAIGKFRSLVGLARRVRLALDVGCGTGQSTIALVDIADRVIGIDSSADMLNHATRHLRVAYQQAMAESIPFRDGEFDLVTVGQAYHWFDYDTFLEEAFRLLSAPGWVVVYTSWFTGTMRDESAFADWWKGEYLHRFPTPPRNRTPITEELARNHGFAFHGEHEFFDDVSMTLGRFTEFLLSTSNVIAAVEDESDAFEAAGGLIGGSLERFFEGASERVFPFGGKLWILEKT